MQWYKVEIIKPKTEKDRLGNDFRTGEFEVIKETRGRFTPYDAVTNNPDKDLSVTKNSQLIAIPCTDILPGAMIRMNNIVYEITERKYMRPRWIILEVKNYHDKNDNKPG